MLSCKEVAARASALIDGELTLWERAQMRLHLTICKGCSAFIAQMRVTRALTSIPVAPVAADNDARISAILAEAARRL
ncbi:MAG: zf-HC2 domain-containing protein [bacterium]